MNELEIVAPDIYEELDNLTDEYGRTIHVIVTELASNATYKINGEEWDLIGGTYAVSRRGRVYDPISNKSNTIGIAVRANSSTLILAHEGGHAVYYSNGGVMEYYYELLQYNPDWKTKGGHAKNDPNGITADAYERMFLMALKAYKRKQKVLRKIQKRKNK